MGLAACSTWIMLNHVTRKLSKYPEEMREKMKFLSPAEPRYTDHPPHTVLRFHVYRSAAKAILLTVPQECKPRFAAFHANSCSSPTEVNQLLLLFKAQPPVHSDPRIGLPKSVEDSTSSVGHGPTRQNGRIHSIPIQQQAYGSIFCRHSFDASEARIKIHQPEREPDVSRHFLHAVQKTDLPMATVYC